MTIAGDTRRFRAPYLTMIVVVVAMAGLMLTACGSGSSPATVPPTRTPKPTFTEVASNPTATSSATPLPLPTSTATATPSPSPTPTATLNPYLNPLTGEMVEDPAVLQRRPLLVRIGNDPEVRPQSGLSQADMVWEEAMDGWTLTRLTAIIWSKDPELLRPVRSARLFTIELGHMFDGALVHSGANDSVRWLLSQSGLTDLDEYFNSTPYYWVEPEGKWASYPWMGRVVTTAARLRAYLEAKGWEKAVQLPGFTFSSEGDPVPDGDAATYVHIPYPRRAVVEFEYDAAQGLYRRFVQGEPHTDALNGEQLTAANVIVHYAIYEETDVLDVNGVPTFNIISTGEGRAQILRDGVMIEAKWVRPGMKDFVRYVYLDGSPVPLKPGQSWVEVVPTDYQITYEAE
jgi:hypothetical protein